MEEHESGEGGGGGGGGALEDDLEHIHQPDRFDLELELVRWVKIAASKTIPPVMCKPGGPITQHYGLDSKSRWREAVCVMMLESDPHLETEGTNKLGRQLAQLFRQDLQLWEVKARQLHNWVKRGLTNVKLLDRTLAYFQNQSSWLQYIKNLKNPIPMIESPGFPGTQWSEHYWKEQTVMLLMQEADFPQGSDPVFCARLFREEPGKWKLKMEQFKRWLEKGKSDPLPEYFGTGKNCPECGLFLWDTRSFLKHMKRNHGVKIKEGEKCESGRESPDGATSPPLLFISDKTKSPNRDVNSDSSATARSTGTNTKDGVAAKSPRDLGAEEEDKFPATSDSEPSTSQATSSRHSTPSRSGPSSGSGADPPKRGAGARADDIGVENQEDSGPSLLSLTLPSRSAATKREERMSGANRQVFCPECNYKCSHSKIVDHLLKCKKALQANQPDRPASPKLAPAESSSAVPSSSRAKEPVAASSSSSSTRPKSSPFQKTNNIVKKVFWKKFESERQQQQQQQQQQNNANNSSGGGGGSRSVATSRDNTTATGLSPEPYKSPDSSSYRSPEQARSPDEYKPPLKLKLSRKEGSQDSPYFEINKPIISSLLRQNMNRFSPTGSSRGGGGSQSPLSDRSPSHTRSPVPSSPSYRSPVRSPTPTGGGGGGGGESRSPAHYTAISSTVTSPRTQPLPTTPSPVDLSMKSSSEEVKVPPPVKVIIKKYELAKSSVSIQLKDKDSEKSRKAEEKIRDEKEVDPAGGGLDAGLDAGGDEGRSGLRGRARNMLSCPLCSSEFAILSNLEKHIDREHKDLEKPLRKRRSVTMKKVDNSFSSLSASSPPKRSRKSTGDGKSAEASDTSLPDTSMDTSTDSTDGERKLTEYEIFQSLQLKSDMERRKVACKECGKLMPPNNLKRHQERHAKEAAGELSPETGEGDLSPPLSSGSASKKGPAVETCTVCDKEIKKSMMKRHLAKHKKEEESAQPTVEAGSSTSSTTSSDDRIPCTECGKRLPKNAMKRHLMKHEADNFMPSTGKVECEDVKMEPDPETSTSTTTNTEPSPRQQESKGKGERKKIVCDLCGLPCAPNTYKRHLEKHRREDQNPGEVFAPIEITPTKDYWEMNDVKPNLDKIKANLNTGASSAPGGDNLNSLSAASKAGGRAAKESGTKESQPAQNEDKDDAFNSSNNKSRGKKEGSAEKSDTHLPNKGAGGRKESGPSQLDLLLKASRSSSSRSTSRSRKESGGPTDTIKGGKRSKEASLEREETTNKVRKEAEEGSLKNGKGKKDAALEERLQVKVEDEGPAAAKKDGGARGSAATSQPARGSAATSQPARGSASVKCAATSQPAKSDARKPEKKTSLSSTGSTGSEESQTTKLDNNSQNVSKDESTDDKKVNKYIKEVQEQERGKVSGSDEEGEGPLEQAVRKVVSYKMTPKQALQIYNLTPKVLFDYLLGETDEDRMAILKKVNLKSCDEDQVIKFCTENEDHLSYKSVISFVKELKHKDGDEEFTLTRLEAYRWWYAFRKKFDLKITAKKK